MKKWNIVDEVEKKRIQGQNTTEHQKRHGNLHAGIKAEIKEKSTNNWQNEKNLVAGIKAEIKKKNTTYQQNKHKNLPADLNPLAARLNSQNL